MHDCDCDPGSFEQCDTDGEATFTAYEHWRARLALGANAPLAALYWRVHGPSGHVIALHDTSLGELPQPPVAYAFVDRET